MLFNKFKSKIQYLFTFVILVIVILVILFNSLVQLYKEKQNILKKLGLGNHNYWGLETPNKTHLSEKQLPQKDHKNLVLSDDEEKMGLWSSPFNWNVIAIHSSLLPDGRVLSFGSYAANDIWKKDNTKANKKITLSDNFKLHRDDGDHQWQHHNVQAGVDMDIWDPTLGVGQESHKIFNRPLIWDAFCSIVRVMNFNEVFILGGNKEPKDNGPDTQNATVIFDLKKNKFTRFANLNFDRWYGSIVRLKNDKLLMLGGVDITVDNTNEKHKEHIKTNHEAGGHLPSTIPELLYKNDNGIYEWQALYHLESNKFFGSDLSDEWSYPKSFVLSDGSVVGISYNKIWKIDKELKEIKQVGEITLKKNGYIKKIQEKIDPNSRNDERDKKLILGNMGSGVGSSSVALMIRENQIILIGGDQKEDEFLPSSEVHLIDFSLDKNKPIVKKLSIMNFPRSNLNATILPDGNIFVNGGHAYKDREFSIYEGEIYNFDKNEWSIVSSGQMRRNYHSSSLLLLDGSILVAGGDVWNAEIFYPPYLFKKDEKFKTSIAKRLNIDVNFKKLNNDNFNKFQIILNDNLSDLKDITLLSSGSVTHAQPSESRFYKLKFKSDKNNLKKINVDLSETFNDLQKGMYIIFVIDIYGVPSRGIIIEIA